jgi:predicted regulator of Ras-like GTPase activity (Roadblock/LC7/MglB family)
MQGGPGEPVCGNRGSPGSSYPLWEKTPKTRVFKRIFLIAGFFPKMVRSTKTDKTICIYAPIRYYQLHRVVQQEQEHKNMLKEKISAFIEQVRSIEGVAACALVSRDGIIAGKHFDRNEPWFGALSATILASAESIGSIVRMKSLGSVIIKAGDSSIVIMGAGENFLIAAIISDSADPTKIHAQMLEIAQKIREAM